MDFDPNIPTPTSAPSFDKDRIVSWLRNQFSLDTPEQDFFSAETLGDALLGSVPGLNIPLALRDMERARRAKDPVAGGLAAASLLPFGKLAGALRNKSEIIAGRGARTAPTEAINRAEMRLKAGGNPETIWAEHGAFQGAETHKPMKWEIPDQGAQLKDFDITVGARGNSGFPTHGDFEGRLGDFLDHPELFKAYPEMADWQLLAKMEPKSGGAGRFRESQGMGPHKLEASGRNLDELMSTILHEAQHGVQMLEGFGKGTNPQYLEKLLIANLRKKFPSFAEGSALSEQQGRKARDMYDRTMGEVEAKNVEDRLRNSPGFNRTVAPFVTQRVPNEMQLEFPAATIADLLRR